MGVLVRRSESTRYRGGKEYHKAADIPVGLETLEYNCMLIPKACPMQPMKTKLQIAVVCRSRITCCHLLMT